MFQAIARRHQDIQEHLAKVKVGNIFNLKKDSPYRSFRPNHRGNSAQYVLQNCKTLNYNNINKPVFIFSINRTCRAADQSQRNLSIYYNSIGNGMRRLLPFHSITSAHRYFSSYRSRSNFNLDLNCVKLATPMSFSWMITKHGKQEGRDILRIQNNINLVHLQLRKFSHSKQLGMRRKRYSENEDEKQEKPLTVEKQLLNLMEMWKMDEAVKLLVGSLKTGFTPNSGVILNLLQQLAHLGEVDSILDLHDEFLKEKNVTREVKFYALLTDAYCNSGRVDECVAMLRIIYHKTRNFDDTDPFFTMITIMILRNFEHHLQLIEDFVTDLKERDPPEDKVVASLWKCFVLTERFEQADALIEDHETLSKLVPAQVSNIIHAPFYVTYDKDTVLAWLVPCQHIKKALRAAVMEALIQHKCEEDKLQEALDLLREAMVHDATLIKKSTLTHFVTSFLGQLPEEELMELEDWAQSLDDEDGEENDLDDDEGGRG